MAVGTHSPIPVNESGTRGIQRAQQTTTTTTQDNNQPTTSDQIVPSCHRAIMVRLIVESVQFYVKFRFNSVSFTEATRHGSWLSLGRIVRGYSYSAWELKKITTPHHVAFHYFRTTHYFGTTTTAQFFFFIGDRQQPTNTDHGSLRSLLYLLHYGLPLPFYPIVHLVVAMILRILPSSPLVHLKTDLPTMTYRPTSRYLLLP